jgi:hypothetical protein
MAFWLAPGEKSFGRPALNHTVLSDHLVSKRVRIGYKKLANVIEYEVIFTIPKGERHTYAQFEALTGYMPDEFGHFWKFVPATGKLEGLDDGPAEQRYPVIFATKGGNHAMGVFSPDQPSSGYERAGYGGFRFEGERVVKWNCVFRSRSEKGIAPGDYQFRMFVAVGTLEDVRQALNSLVQDFGGRRAENNGVGPNNHRLDRTAAESGSFPAWRESLSRYSCNVAGLPAAVGHSKRSATFRT